MLFGHIEPHTELRWGCIPTGLLIKLIFSRLNAHQITKANYSIVNPRSIFLKDTICSIVIQRESKNQVLSGSSTQSTVHINLLCSYGNRQRSVHCHTEELRNRYLIREIQTQGLDSVVPSSTTIAMVDDDGSPSLARTLRIRSTGVCW
ncbi:hypothetical protein CR513_29866, partial [Mucuna pruriens]